MIELKVVCDCGQKFKFDVEPVNGQMPFAVACPICQRDGTAKANAMLQQMSVFKMVEPAPAAAAPPPIAPAAPPPPPPPSAPSRLRINATAPAETAAPPAIAPVAAAASAPARIGGLPQRTESAAAEPGKEPSFAKGMMGGFIGALVGGIIYYLIYKFTGVRIGLAIGVGALAGWLANFLGRGEGSKELGGITAVLVLVAVIAAQYFVALEKWNKVVHAYEDAGYTDSINEAKEVVKAVPTGSDGEIRLYLAKQNSEPGEAIKLESVSADEIKEFREKQLPAYQEMAGGKVTKDQYLAKNGLDAEKMKKIPGRGERDVQGNLHVDHAKPGGIDFDVYWRWHGLQIVRQCLKQIETFRVRLPQALH